MEKTLQHEETTQCFGLPPTGSRNHRPDGPGTGHALTFKVDHSMGADHRPRANCYLLNPNAMAKGEDVKAPIIYDSKFS